ncbi:MAG: tetratricopeptide repeat protein [Hydrococcus sp. Prado102]|jgi:CHAT domain-containing protein/Tfp pilus assembly protein PilF|nr:tetratricopeptide repeat protein [Hydrococcus sp. Prado102]
MFPRLQLACAIAITLALSSSPSLASRYAQTQTLPDATIQLYQQGIKQFNRGQFQDALKTFEQVLPLARQINDKKLEATSLTQIGTIYRRLGQYDRALEFLEQALAINIAGKDKINAGITLYNLGQVYERLGQYDRALESFQGALAIAKNTKNLTLEGTTLHNLGQVYDKLARYDRAIASLQQAIAIHQKRGDRKMEGRTLSNLGIVYRNLGQYSLALQTLQQALNLSQKINDRPWMGTILNNLGSVYVNLSQYDKAMQSLQQALTLSRETRDKILEGAILTGIGDVYRSRGESSKALALFQQSLAIYQKTGSKAESGIVLNNIGQAYTTLALYPQALDALQQAFAIHQEVGNRAMLGTTFINLGSVHLNLGQSDKALAFFKQALTISREIGDRAKEGITLNYLARILARENRFEEALKNSQKALTIFNQIGDRAELAATFNNLGQIYLAQKQSEKALSFYQRSLAINQALGNRLGLANTYNDLGLVYLNLKQSDSALDFLKRSLALSEDIEDKLGQGTILSNLGYLHWRLRQNSQAEKYLVEAIKILESLRPGLKDFDKITIFEEQRNLYELLQEIAIAQNKTNFALEIAERGRARAYAELLASRILNIPPEKLTISSIAIEQIQQIARQENAILIEYSLVGNSIYIWVVRPTGQINFTKIDRTSLKLSIDELVSETRASIGVRNRGEPQQIAFLPGDLVKLNSDAPDYEPWEVVASKADDNRLSLRQSSFPQGVTIERPATDVVAKVESRRSNNRYLQQLHQLLIEPIANFLPSDPNANIIFIPQNELFLVPFAALQDSQGKYLIEKHTIRTVPSIQVLGLTRKLKQNKHKKGDILIVGNPTMPKLAFSPKEPPQPLSSLPEAEREAQKIARLLQVQPLIGDRATKTTVMEKMSGARIIHFATHGLLEKSAIALASDTSLSGQNGLLSDEEILQMKLEAELVVLSACNTGGGRISGDGVLGLSRSFIAAGVPSAIVSLWTVPDASTADLMSEFYQYLQNNLDNAQALRQAMLATMERYPHPRNWAAFILIGN